MGVVKHGSAQVQIAGDVRLDPKAGTLTAEQVRHMAKAPGEVGPALSGSADALKTACEVFVPPVGVTVESLYKLAEEATAYTNAVRDLDVLTETVKQGKLIFEEQAYEVLRKLNDQVKAQGKYNDKVLEIFEALTEFVTSNKGGHVKKTA